MAEVVRDLAQIRRDAMAAVVTGQWETAIVMLREYLGLQPEDAKVWTSLAACCERSGDDAGTVEALRAAAEAWERDGFLPQAIAHWTKLARLLPSDGWADMKLGGLCLALGRRADAAAHYANAERFYTAQGRGFEATQAQERLDELSGDARGRVEAAQRRVEPGVCSLGKLGVDGSLVSSPNGDGAEAFISDRMENAQIMRRYGLLSMAQKSMEDVLARFPSHVAAGQLQIDVLREVSEQGRAAAVQTGFDEHRSVPGGTSSAQPRREARHSQIAGQRLGIWLRRDSPNELDDEIDIVIPDGPPPDTAGTAAGPSPELFLEPNWDALLGAMPARAPGLGCFAARSPSSFELLLSGLESSQVPGPTGETSAPRAGPPETSGEPSSGLARGAQTGIVSTTSQADEATRFDLALAFLQVGLDEDAMRELQVLAQGSERVFEASVGLGRIFFERGLAQTASRWFERAMAAPGQSSSDYQRVHYSLGRACEAAGDVVRALDIYVDLHTADARFEDVAERLGRLRSSLASEG